MPLQLKDHIDQLIEEEQEDRKLFGRQGTSAFSESSLYREPLSYEEQQEFWNTRSSIDSEDPGLLGGIYDMTSHGLWNAFDTASFGALDWLDVDQMVWGGEYGEDIIADNLWAKTGAALGTVAGFIAPLGPVRAGSKAATLLAREGARLAGKPILSTVAKETGKKALYEVGEAAVKKGVSKKTATSKLGKMTEQEIREQAGDFGLLFSKGLEGNMAKMSTNLNKATAGTKAFKESALRHIDDAVAQVKTSVTATRSEKLTAETIGKVYKDSFSALKSRPIQDVFDLVGTSFGKYSYGIAAMMHEATMFALIDATSEVFRSMDEERDYDMSAPVWGAITGSLFGSLKFLKPAGKQSSGWKDISTGIAAVVNAPRKLGKKTLPQLEKEALWLGEDLSRGGREIVNYRVGKNNVEFDLTQPKRAMDELLYSAEKAGLVKAPVISKTTGELTKASLTSRDSFKEGVYRDLLGKQFDMLGKEAIAWGKSTSIMSAAENWKKMVLGTLFMNLHTIHDISQGHEIPTEDIAINVILGAYLNRKGQGRVYDLTPRRFNHDINTIRQSIDRLGITNRFVKGNQYQYMHRTLDPKEQPNLSGLQNDPEMFEAAEMFRKQGNTTSLFSEQTRPVPKGEQAVGTWSPGMPYPTLKKKSSKYHGETLDMPLWTEFTRDLKHSITESPKYDNSVKLEHALEIQAYFKSIGIETAPAYLSKTDRMVESKVDDFSYIFRKTTREILTSINKDFEGRLGSPHEFAMGEIPAAVIFTPELAASVKSENIGELRRVFDGKTDITTQWKDFKDSIKKIWQVTEDTYGAKPVKGKNIIVKDTDQIVKLKGVLDANMDLFNKRMGVLNPKYKFDWLNTYGAETQVAARFVQKITDNVNTMFDISGKKNVNWQDFSDVLSKATFLKGDTSIGFTMPDHPSKLKVRKGEKTSDAQIANDEALLRYVWEIFESKGQIIPRTGEKGIELSPEQVSEIRSFLKNNGIPTNRSDIEFFGPEFRRRIVSDIIDKAEMDTGDIEFLRRIASAEYQDQKLSDPQLGLVTLKTNPERGVVGFNYSINSWIEGVLSSRSIERLTTINKYLDNLKENSNGYVTPKDRPVVFTNDADVEVYWTNFKVSRESTNMNAREAMTVFLEGLDPRNKTRRLLVEFFRRPENHGDIARVQSWMYQLGAFKKGVKRSDGSEDVTKWTVNTKVVASRKFVAELEQKLETYGINTNEIEQLYQQHSLDLQNKLADTYGAKISSGLVSEAAFFDKYFPSPRQAKGIEKFSPKHSDEHGWKYYNSLKTAESKNEYIKASLFTKKGKLFKGGFKKVLDEIQRNDGFASGSGNSRYQATMDLAVLAGRRLQGGTTTVLSYSNGDLLEMKNPVHTFKNRLVTSIREISGPGHVILDGEANVMGFFAGKGKAYKRSFNLFERNSDLNSARELELKNDTYKDFLSLAEAKLIKTGKVTGKGLSVIELPDMAIGVDRGTYSEVRNQFRDLNKKYEKYFDLKNKEFPNAVSKYKKLMERLDQTTEWSHDYSEAYRVLLLEKMIYSSKNGQDIFMKYLNASVGGKEISAFIKRFSLFGDSKARKHSPEIDETLSVSKDISPAELNTINKYKSKKDKDGDQVAEVAFINDDIGSKIKSDIVESFNKMMEQEALKNPKFRKDVDDPTSFKDFQYFHQNRKKESSFDSISIINPNYADYLGLHYGTPESRIFKPSISSAGEGEWLLLGKTAFFVDPNFNKFFSGQNKNIDILMVKSADKLKSIPDNVYTDLTDVELLSGDTKLSSLAIKSKRIGIIKSFAGNSPAKYAPSTYQNYASDTIAGEIFEQLYYPRLIEGVRNFNSIRTNDLQSNIAIKNKLGGSNDLDNIYQLSADYAHLSDLKTHVSLAPYASPSTYDPKMTRDVLKNKFIEPAIAPYASFHDPLSGKQVRTGGKSVLMQSLSGKETKVKYNGKDVVLAGNELEPTIFDPNTRELLQYGEMYAPYNMRAENILAPGAAKKFNVYASNNATNEIVTIKEALRTVFENSVELQGKYKNKDFDNYWNVITSNPEGQMGYAFDQLRKYAGREFDIVNAVLRYPRTRPDDFTFLRIKDFLHPDYNNAAVVNKHDVYNIFEGDYDIDTIDYFWNNPKATKNYIMENQQNWVNSVNSQKYSYREIDVQFADPRGGLDANNAWSKAFGNKMAMKKAIGFVQGTVAQVNYMYNFFPKNKKGQAIILENKNGDQVVMDWNVTEWFWRQALEGQLVLDASGKIPEIVKESIFTLRPEQLFPDKLQSLSANDFKGPDGKPSTGLMNDFHLKMKEGTEKRRIRLFKKMIKQEDGRLVESNAERFNELDKDLIMAMMGNYSKLNLAFMRDKVFEGGQQKQPRYDQYLDAHREYNDYLLLPTDKLWSNLTRLKKKDQPKVPKWDITKESHKKLIGEYFDFTEHVYERHKWTNKDNKWSQLKIEDAKPYQKYVWPNKESALFTKEAYSVFRDRTENVSGTIAERMMKTIYNEDPMHANFRKTLTGTELKKFQLVETLALGTTIPDSDALIEILPKAIATLNQASSYVGRTNDIIKKVRNSNKDWEDKNRIIKSLEGKIDSYTNDAKFKGLVKEEWNKIAKRKEKSIPRINILSVLESEGFTDAVVAENVLNFVKTTAHPVSYAGMPNRIREHKIEIGKQYGVKSDLAGRSKYGEKSLETLDSKRRLHDINKPIEAIEADLDARMTAGVRDYGIPYIYHFMSASIDPTLRKSNNINAAVINGRVVGSAIKPEGSYHEHNRHYKRGLKYMLKVVRGEIVGMEHAAGQYAEIYRQLMQKDYFWRQYFKGDFNSIDVSSEHGIRTMLGDPFKKGPGFGIHPKLQQYITNYSNLTFGREVSESNPFTMGKKYNSTFAFYRALFAGSVSKGANLEKLEKGFSYLHQVMGENGYLNPMQHMNLMAHISKELSPRVVSDMFPSQLDLNTKTAKPLYSAYMLRNPIFHLLGGGKLNGNSGLGLDPNMHVNKRHVVDNMINTTLDMRNTSTSRTEGFINEVETSVSKGGKDYKGREC